MINQANIDIKIKLRLVDLKRIVKTNHEAVMRWSLALLEIRNDKLYLVESKSFEEFCQKNFGWEMNQVRRMWRQAKEWEGQRLIAETTAEPINKTDFGRHVESNMSQPANTRDANAEISNHFLSRIGATPTSPPAKVIDIPATPGPKKELPLIANDDMGYPIPEGARALWGRRHELTELMTKLSDIKCLLERAFAENDPLFRGIRNTIIPELTGVRYQIGRFKPYAVCTDCQGHPNLNKSPCPLCFGKGLIGKEDTEVITAKEKLAMRMKQIKALK